MYLHYSTLTNGLAEIHLGWIMRPTRLVSRKSIHDFTKFGAAGLITAPSTLWSAVGALIGAATLGFALDLQVQWLMFYAVMATTLLTSMTSARIWLTQRTLQQHPLHVVRAEDIRMRLFVSRGFHEKAVPAGMQAMMLAAIDRFFLSTLPLAEQYRNVNPKDVQELAALAVQIHNHLDQLDIELLKIQAAHKAAEVASRTHPRIVALFQPTRTTQPARIRVG